MYVYNRATLVGSLLLWIPYLVGCYKHLAWLLQKYYSYSSSCIHTALAKRVFRRAHLLSAFLQVPWLVQCVYTVNGNGVKWSLVSGNVMLVLTVIVLLPA